MSQRAARVAAIARAMARNLALLESVGIDPDGRQTDKGLDRLEAAGIIRSPFDDLGLHPTVGTPCVIKYCADDCVPPNREAQYRDKPAYHLIITGGAENDE